MRFTLTTGLGDFQDWATLAQTAETTGFHAFSIPDSTFYPKRSDSAYPYNDTGKIRGYIEATPFIEPMIAFSWMAAVTRKLRFYPNVMKVPVRSPIILAKLISSLAVMSDNRFILGAGIGPWEEDFTYNGLNWSKRGKLLDECIEIIRGLMTGDYFEFHSENYDFGPIKLNPVPTQPVPIIIGGHAPPALRRAARIGDGWVSVNGDITTLKPMIDEINRYRAEYGTIDKPYEIHIGNFDFERSGPPPTLDDYRRLEEIGATDYCVVPLVDPTLDLQQKIDIVNRFGDEVISKLR
ncbi:TIGR03619 family F420-dependent LLM class oxidoreductase [Sphingomonadaceae bacterium G21617-S1]|nr:TIGR03619 family F420-dependent LLM class oxidoreductase [Sphingomonadaceae bacterium G21617-S1]